MIAHLSLLLLYSLQNGKISWKQFTIRLIMLFKFTENFSLLIISAVSLKKQVNLSLWNLSPKVGISLEVGRTYEILNNSTRKASFYDTSEIDFKIRLVEEVHLVQIGKDKIGTGLVHLRGCRMDQWNPSCNCWSYWRCKSLFPLGW